MSAKKSLWRSLFKWGFILGVTGVLVLSGALIAIYFKLSPNLPSIESLKNVQFQVPLRVYTSDGYLISEFGEKRREPVTIESVPAVLKNAFLAAEDDRFYEHPGVDYQGILRAVINLIRTGERGQGGSTITMQVARNFFLSNKKTYERKLNEIFLALRIESELSKDKILELYLNKIYLGNRAYGVSAASQVYYGKDVSELNLAEAAMIAGLPKAPSRYNPIVNPERALIRRNYVLRRMFELGLISPDEYRETLELTVTARLHYSKPEIEAAYVAEMVRSRLQSLYGDRIYTAGLNVYTTVLSKNQTAANAALRKALIDYEKRHGFSGPIGKVNLAGMPEEYQASETEDLQTEPDYTSILEQLKSYSQFGGLSASVVLQLESQHATVLLSDGKQAEIRFEDSEWARLRTGKDKLGKELKGLNDVLQVGDVIYVEKKPEGEQQIALLSQLPSVEGALVSLQPQTGAVLALVGGFDFHRSKFNRVTQARRQPGSNFKPFIYSAAIENGDTAATVYNDAPVVFHDSALEGEWRPENYSGRFYGPTRLREALVKSRNLVSIRVLRGLGLRKSLDYVGRFGFEIDKLPADLSLALGSGSVTPLQLANAYGVFANRGYLTEPYFIRRIEDSFGQVIFMAPEIDLCDKDCGADVIVEAGVDLGVASEEKANNLAGLNTPEDTAGGETEPEEAIKPLDRGIYKAPRVIEERNAYIMTSILREVVTRGTAQKAKALKRKDLAGKTGTTNDQHDAWFSGFNSQVSTSVWVGYDELQPLGVRETGGRAALPMWMDYMAKALEEVPEDKTTQPPRLLTVRIDKKTGELASGRNKQSMFEVFRAEKAPAKLIKSTKSNRKRTNKNQAAVKRAFNQADESEEPLF